MPGTSPRLSTQVIRTARVYADARSCGGDRIAETEDDCTQEPAPPAAPLAVDCVNVTGPTFGTLTAAHVDGLFNNAGEWEHLRATHISYNAGEAGAVIEMFVPWEEIDALAVLNLVDEDTGVETEIETGLHHPFAPSNDDVWFFNVTRQSTEPSNFLPQWHWTSSLYFASHGFAFKSCEVSGPVTTQVQADAGQGPMLRDP